MAIKGDKALMISVLAQAITDYIQAVKVGGLDFSKRLKQDGAKENKTSKEKLAIVAMTRGDAAKAYIFDNSKHSEEYVFGFKFICSYIGIEPMKFRNSIKEKREEFWRDIYKKIKEM